jgi:pimeloyl-ACP methyl ester carboxylesterase
MPIDGRPRPPVDQNVPPPHPLLALTEAHRVVLEVLSLRLARGLLASAPAGDGHPVMILPGFLGSDGYNAAFRRYLTRQGYAVHGWAQGRNLGPRDGVLEALVERVEFLASRYGGPISLVGHSLGGIFARELARELPARVRQVISLGSPFGEGRWTGSYPARLFASLNPRDDLPIPETVLPTAPPVPTTAIYSKGDGICNWRTARQAAEAAHAQTQSIQVRGSHCGMTLNPAIWFLVAERLAQPADDWRPFRPREWAWLLYPACQ